VREGERERGWGGERERTTEIETKKMSETNRASEIPRGGGGGGERARDRERERDRESFKNARCLQDGTNSKSLRTRAIQENKV